MSSSSDDDHHAALPPAHQQAWTRHANFPINKPDDAGGLNSPPSITHSFSRRVIGLSRQPKVSLLSEVLAGLRVIKSDAEIKVMREAGRISGRSVVEVSFSLTWLFNEIDQKSTIA
jgi:Xaa-Pro aminopeptidase